MKIPTEEALAEFFGVEPTFHEYTAHFDLTDSNGVRLMFTFNYATNEVSTEVRVNGEQVQIDWQENASSMEIMPSDEGPMLVVGFKFTGYELTLRLRVSPTILIRWNGIEI